jgi:hypothetical protein
MMKNHDWAQEKIKRAQAFLGMVSRDWGELLMVLLDRY